MAESVLAHLPLVLALPAAVLACSCPCPWAWAGPWTPALAAAVAARAPAASALAELALPCRCNERRPGTCTSHTGGPPWPLRTTLCTAPKASPSLGAQPVPARRTALRARERIERACHSLGGRSAGANTALLSSKANPHVAAVQWATTVPNTLWR